MYCFADMLLQLLLCLYATHIVCGLRLIMLPFATWDRAKWVAEGHQ